MKLHVYHCPSCGLRPDRSETIIGRHREKLCPQCGNVTRQVKEETKRPGKLYRVVWEHTGGHRMTSEPIEVDDLSDPVLETAAVLLRFHNHLATPSPVTKVIGVRLDVVW